MGSINRKIRCWARICWKKMQKNRPREVIGRKLLHTKNKSQKLFFSVTFFAWFFLQLSQRLRNQQILDHIRTFCKLWSQNADETAQKNEKCFLLMWPGLALKIRTKKSAKQENSSLFKNSILLNGKIRVENQTITWVWAGSSLCTETSTKSSIQEFHLKTSVVDPDPDTPDPHVFGPPGSGSTSQRYGSGFGSWSFYLHAKIVRKTSIPTSILWPFLTFYL